MMNYLVVILNDILNQGEIGSSYYTLSESLLDNLEQISKLSICQLANRCKVSKSTLSRFVREIGCYDYQEFQEISEKKVDLENNQVVKSLMKKGINAYYQDVQYSLALVKDSLNIHAIDDLVKEMYKAKNVYVFGVLDSQYTAFSFQHRISKYGLHIKTIANHSRLKTIIENIQKDDLMICLSVSGSFFSNDKENYQPGRKCLKDCRGKIAVLTSNQGLLVDPLISNCVYFKSISGLHASLYILNFMLDIVTYRYKKYIDKININ